MHFQHRVSKLWILRGYKVTRSAIPIEILIIYKQKYIVTINIGVLCIHFQNITIQKSSKLMKTIGTLNQLKHNSQNIWMYFAYEGKIRWYCNICFLHLTIISKFCMVCLQHLFSIGENYFYSKRITNATYFTIYI